MREKNETYYFKHPEDYRVYFFTISNDAFGA